MCIFIGGNTARFTKLGPSSELGCSGIKPVTVWVWTCALLNTLGSGGVLVGFFSPVLVLSVLSLQLIWYFPSDENLEIQICFPCDT